MNYTPRYNYYPPAGEVINQTDQSITWNGRAWVKGGRVVGVPANHRLVGRPGGSHSGWYYDWGKRAWMEPTRGPSPQPQPRPNPGLIRPQPQPRPNPQPQPQPQPQPTAPTPPDRKECSVDKKDANVLDYLIKHPIAPLAGAFVLVGSMLAEEPQPPAIPPGLPDEIGKTWQMIYAQNLARYQKRMQLWEVVGKALLGYTEVNAVLSALPAKKAA